VPTARTLSGLAALCAVSGVLAGCGSTAPTALVKPAPTAQATATPAPTPPAPEPGTVVHAALSYLPTLAEIPQGFHASGDTGHALTGDPAAGTSDTAEVIYDGPGRRRVVTDVYIYPDTDTASQAIDSMDGVAPGDPPTTVLTAPGIGSRSFLNLVHLSSGKPNAVDFYELAWREGRIVFMMTDRYLPGANSPTEIDPMASAVDLTTHTG